MTLALELAALFVVPEAALLAVEAFDLVVDLDELPHEALVPVFVRQPFVQQLELTSLGRIEPVQLVADRLGTLLVEAADLAHGDGNRHGDGRQLGAVPRRFHQFAKLVPLPAARQLKPTDVEVGQLLARLLDGDPLLRDVHDLRRRRRLRKPLGRYQVPWRRRLVLLLLLDTAALVGPLLLLAGHLHPLLSVRRIRMDGRRRNALLRLVGPRLSLSLARIALGIEVDEAVWERHGYYRQSMGLGYDSFFG